MRRRRRGGLCNGQICGWWGELRTKNWLRIVSNRQWREICDRWFWRGREPQAWRFSLVEVALIRSGFRTCNTRRNSGFFRCLRLNDRSSITHRQSYRQTQRELDGSDSSQVERLFAHRNSVAVENRRRTQLLLDALTRHRVPRAGQKYQMQRGLPRCLSFFSGFKVSRVLGAVSMPKPSGFARTGRFVLRSGTMIF